MNALRAMKPLRGRIKWIKYFIAQSAFILFIARSAFIAPP
jgi:hypothetical protein